MGWNAIVAGDVEVDEAQVGAWKALAIGDASFRSWGPLTTRTPAGVEGTVAEALSKLEDFARACESAGTGDWLELAWSGGRLSARGYLNEDDYRAIGRELATVLRIAEKVGGRGQLLVLADDGADGERTILDEGASRHEPIAMHEVFGGAAVGPLDVDYVAVVNEMFERRASAPEGPPKKAKKPATKKPATKKPATKKASATAASGAKKR